MWWSEVSAIPYLSGKFDSIFVSCIQITFGAHARALTQQFDKLLIIIPKRRLLQVLDNIRVHKYDVKQFCSNTWYVNNRPDPRQFLFLLYF